MLLISKKFEFCASHTLRRPEWNEEKNRAVFGKCSNPNGHGHNYILEVSVRGTVNPETGFVMDASILERYVQELVFRDVDHKNLNLDVLWLQGILPSSENLVNAFWDRLAPALARETPRVTLHRLILWETSRIYVVREEE